MNQAVESTRQHGVLIDRSTSAELAIARVEGTRLLRNPFVWLAVVPSAMWASDTKRALDDGEAEDVVHVLTGYLLLLPGFATIVVVVLAVLRSRSAHADDLLDTLPVGRAQRSVAHGWSTAANALFGALIMAAAFVYLWPSSTLGPFAEDATLPWLEAPRPNVAQLLQGPIALAAVTAGVVALVRWVPTWLVLVPLPFLLMLQGLWFGMFNAATPSWFTWLWPLANGVVHDGYIGGCDEGGTCSLLLTGFDRTTPWWHIGYLLSLGTWFVTIAVLRNRRDRTAWTAFVVSLTTTVGFAIVQAAVYVRPLYTQ